jgi:LAO/AO transport system kinase
MLDLSQKEFDLKPPIIKTVATTGIGIDELEAKISEHLSYIQNKGLLEQKRKEKTREKFMELIKFHISKMIFQEKGDIIETLLKDISNKVIDPYTAMEKLLQSIIKGE